MVHRAWSLFVIAVAVQMCMSTGTKPSWLDAYPSLQDPSSIDEWHIGECSSFFQGANGLYSNPRPISRDDPDWHRIMVSEPFSRITQWIHEKFKYSLYLLDDERPSNPSCTWKLMDPIPSARGARVVWLQRCPCKHELPILSGVSPLLTYWEQVTSTRVQKVNRKTSSSNELTAKLQLTIDEQEAIIEKQERANLALHRQISMLIKGQQAEVLDLQTRIAQNITITANQRSSSETVVPAKEASSSSSVSQKWFEWRGLVLALASCFCVVLIGALVWCAKRRGNDRSDNDPSPQHQQPADGKHTLAELQKMC